MTTTFLLVRHAAHDLLGRVLTGRMAGVSLGAEGRAQAQSVAKRLGSEAVAAVYTSPLERACETAAPIAGARGRAPQVLEGITEVDYGEWSGTSFQELDQDPAWAMWNRSKGTQRPPGGESLLEVQCRAIAALEKLSAAHAGASVVVVSHGDVIKAALAHYLGLALENISRFEISPASVSTVAVGPWGAKVHAINEVARP